MRVIRGQLQAPPEEPAVTHRDSIQFDGATIEYQVRRSKRRKKTIQITLGIGGVHVAAPMKTPDGELRAFVLKRAPWILRHVPGAVLEAAPMRFVSGETLPYLGRSVRMIVEPADVPSPEVRFDHWRLRVAVPRSLEDKERRESIRRAVVAWYRARAAQRLTASVDRWWPRLGRGEKSRTLIRDQRQLWGSCAPDGTLRFNWRLVMLEPPLAEYLVVHELAHLTVKGHSTDFWGLVSKAMPDAQRRRRRLHEAGWALPL